MGRVSRGAILLEKSAQYRLAQPALGCLDVAIDTILQYVEPLFRTGVDFPKTKAIGIGEFALASVFLQQLRKRFAEIVPVLLLLTVVTRVALGLLGGLQYL